MLNHRKRGTSALCGGACRPTGLGFAAGRHLASSDAPRGGRRECLGALTTVQNTATNGDLRPTGRSSDVGRQPHSESPIFAPHTKSLDDRGQTHLSTTWRAGGCEYTIGVGRHRCKTLMSVGGSRYTGGPQNQAMKDTDFTTHWAPPPMCSCDGVQQLLSAMCRTTRAVETNPKPSGSASTTAPKPRCGALQRRRQICGVGQWP